MPQKSKLNAEEKVEIIRKYQQGEISLAQAAREASVETATIYRWSTRYEAEGAGGFLSYQKNQRLSIRTKVKGGTGIPVRVMAVSENISKKYETAERTSTPKLDKGVSCSWRFQLSQVFRRRKLHEAGTGHHAGRTCSDRQGLSGQWKKLRRDGLEVQGELPAGTHMDAAVRGDGRRPVWRTGAESERRTRCPEPSWRRRRSRSNSSSISCIWRKWSVTC